MTALECSTSGEKGKIRREMPLGCTGLAGSFDHESGGGSPHFPTDLHQNRRGGRFEAFSSICNWLWPIRRVAPFCTELGSAHRSVSLRLQHSLRMPSFIYLPRIPALIIQSSPRASVLFPANLICCNVICDHGFSFSSRERMLQAKSRDSTVIDEGSEHSSRNPLDIESGIERALYMYSMRKARPCKDYTLYQFN